MYLKQFKGRLNEAAYFVESNGEAIVIDPLQNIEEYISLAKEYNAKIKYIFETHLRPDYISGRIDLSKQTGAPIVYGPKTETNFPFHLAKDGDVFKIGNTTLEVIHTPGHTIASSCFLLNDEKGKPFCIFTGHILFTGDIERPGFGSGSMPTEEYASIMYDTFQNKIIPLADDIIVYPAHERGTINGKNPGANAINTIGEQKKNNYALRPQSREAFIAAVTNDLAEAPPYFSINTKMQKEIFNSLDEVTKKGLTPLELEEFKLKMNDGGLVLDTRLAAEFSNGFIPGSLFIGLEGRFAEWAASLLSSTQPIILVTDFGKEEETIMRLAGVGFTNIEGYLKEGFKYWKKAGEKIDIIIDIEADEFAMDIPFDDNLIVVDVRKENEFNEGHVKNAINLPLNNMTDIAQIAQLEETQNIYLHCSNGYRSLIAASVLKKQGYNNLRNIIGGWLKIKEKKSIKIEKEARALN